MTNTLAKKIPVTIISGFLGAGKTTLLNQILGSNTNTRIAVMVNDFGKINIDSKLIISQTQTTISLANGCVCCTVEGDLIVQLNALIRDPVAGPEHILIEASGISNPSKIASTIRYPQFRDRLYIDSIISILDADQFGRLEGDMANLASEQLDVADIIVINKIDLVSDAELAKLKNNWLYPNARVIETSFSKFPLPLLFGLEQTDSQKNLNDQENMFFDIKNTAPDTSPHSQLFDTWSWSCAAVLDASKLKQVLMTLPKEIYRAKGVCQLNVFPDNACSVHLVGNRVEVAPSVFWEEKTRKTELVFIGLSGSIDKKDLNERLNHCVHI